MNRPDSIRHRLIKSPQVTTGPLIGSRKVHSVPEGHPHVQVPLREIALSNGEAFRVYDPSGPYTDDAVKIDVKQGLTPVRAEWIAARGGVEAYEAVTSSRRTMAGWATNTAPRPSR